MSDSMMLTQARAIAGALLTHRYVLFFLLYALRGRSGVVFNAY
jgi:hypothetical protein